MNKDLLKSKTMWVGIASLIYAISGYYTGNIDFSSALAVGEVALIGMGLRHAI